jgi:hypothetical protein
LIPGESATNERKLLDSDVDAPRGCVDSLCLVLAAVPETKIVDVSSRVPAHEYGILTFMAKPRRSRIGSSCRIHLSLRRDDRAALAGNSELFKQYIERERIFGCG